MQENSHIGEVSEAIEKLGVNFRCTIWYLNNVIFYFISLSFYNNPYFTPCYHAFCKYFLNI